MLMPSRWISRSRTARSTSPTVGANAGYHSRVLKETREGDPRVLRGPPVRSGSSSRRWTATNACGFLRFTFPEGRGREDPGRSPVPLRVRLPGSGGADPEGERHREIEGLARPRPPTSGDEYTLHFVIRFSRPSGRCGGWVGDSRAAATSTRGVQAPESMGGIVGFATERGEPVLVQTGLSLVGIGRGAAQPSEAELGPFGWDFERARVRRPGAVGTSSWGGIPGGGGTERDKVRSTPTSTGSFCAKQTWNDVDGRYVDPREQVPAAAPRSEHLRRGCVLEHLLEPQRAVVTRLARDA